MSTSVIARQSGDDYQANFFWLKAAALNHTPNKGAKIAWELNGTYGFDDVVLYHDPAILDLGEEVSEEYFQVKFHVGHQKGFTCEALTDPEFIGAKKESILQRLYNHYTSDKNKFKRSRYYLVNTWGIDYSDTIHELLDNSGRIKINILNQGTDASKFGKVRKLWREHLRISDEVLFDVLKSLVIKHGYDDEQRLKENLNVSLSHAGLKAVTYDTRSSQYVNLIQQLHKQGKNVFTWQELFDICKREDLIAERQQQARDYHKLGVRSFQRGAENLHLEVDSVLCLQHLFMNRFIINETSWSDEIKPQVESFAAKAIQIAKPLLIHLDTHLSTALYLGYCLDSKYGGLDITIVQKTNNGKLHWRPAANSTLETTNFWKFEEQMLEPGVNDIVLALSVTRDLKPDVEDFVASKPNSFGKVIYGSILPSTGHAAIKDANHILKAAEELMSHVNVNRRGVLRSGKVHLLLSAPNAFAFFLGQQIRPLGQLTLYEFDFENARGGKYQEVITIQP